MNAPVGPAPATTAITAPATTAGPAAVAGDALLPFTPLPQLFAAHAAARPGAPAVWVDGQHLDWATLHQRIGQVARALLAEGLRPGDRVALLAPASLAHVACLFGAVAARACLVPLPTSASLETLQALLADSGARWLFLDPAVGPAQRSLASGLAAQTGLRVVAIGAGQDAQGAADGAEADPGVAAFAAWCTQADPARPLPLAQADDPFNIIYSSGTTGLPKGIVHRHGMRQQQAARKGFFPAGACTLLSTPMSSNTTLMPLLGTLVHGGSCVLMPRFDAGRWLALAAAHRVTHTMLVPVQYQRLMAHPDFDRTDLRALALSQCTGAPTAPALKQALLDRWPGRWLEVYGLTEGGPSCFLDARAHPDKLATVGRPGHGAEVRLIDPQGRPVPADPPGLTGEVVGRSPFMMAGYHQRPEATAALIWHDAQGRAFHRSGDIGRFDADGFLTLLDRIKDVIISGGHNIHAADLEAVLARHPAVADAAVIGVPSAAWGETPLALVVRRPGVPIDGGGDAVADAQALRDWVNAQVGKTQRLSALHWRDELPRSALGKLSKRELRAPFWPAPDAAPAPLPHTPIG